MRPAEVLASSAHFQIFGLAEDAPVRWRLLSGNNRDMGRGAREYPAMSECLAAIGELQGIVAELKVGWRRVGHQWTWQLEDERGPLVHAGAAYDRRVRCEQALTQFVVNAPMASVREHVMISDSRRWAAARSPIVYTRAITPNGRVR